MVMDVCGLFEDGIAGMVIGYLLASNNALALLCKHQENGSEDATKVCVLPEAFPCKCSLGDSQKVQCHALW